MVTVTLEGAEQLHSVIHTITDRTGKLPRTLQTDLKKAATVVMAHAQKLAPQAESSLRRSARVETVKDAHRVEAKITFGGLAAKYAEVQHENEDFAHSEAEYRGKYGHPLSRTVTIRKYRTETTTGRVNKKTGKISISVRQSLKPRQRRHPIKGYRGGQAHFLHGPRSAWEHKRAEIWQFLTRRAQAELRRILMGASGD